MKKALLAAAVLCAAPAVAQIPIYGTVDSKCTIITDTTGVYGNPNPSTLSTLPADGGVMPIVRYDVASADFYKAVITYPNQFDSSPVLGDTVSWTGDVSVSEVSDAGMSAYDTNKVEYNNVTEFELSISGSTWFKVESQAEYGYNKSFPAGDYSASVVAECIAI
jgi:hypothetical protein